MRTPVIMFKMPEYGDFILKFLAADTALYYRWDNNDFKKKKLYQTDLEGMKKNKWVELSKDQAMEARKAVREDSSIQCLVIRDLDAKAIGDLVIDGLPFIL